MAVPSSNRERQRNAMPELKYRRVVEMNQRLREDYDRPRCKTSDACNKYHCPPPSRPVLPGHSPFAPRRASVIANVLITPVLQFDSIYESDKGLHGSVGLGTYRQEG